MALEVSDMTKTFGPTVACDDVNFELGEEIGVLLGPSGCGKTTTLRVVAGLEKPDRGNVIIGGESVNELPPRSRDVAMVFQDIALFPHLSVRKNISFGLDMSKGMGDEKIDKKVEEVAEYLHIDELLDRQPAQLSGGQQQRVGIGRALVMSPQVFLLDEPFANLDADLRNEMRTLVQRLQGEFGVTMLHVTHDQEEAMVLGDTLVVMYDGELQQVGSSEEVYHDPSNRFVAQFMGSPHTNFVENCTAKVDDNEVSIVNEKLDIDLTVTREKLRGELTNPVDFAVRPENLSVVPANSGIPEDEAGLFDDAKVDIVEPTGNSTTLHTVVKDQDIRVLVPGTTTIEENESVKLSVDPARAWLFDSGGERLM